MTVRRPLPLLVVAVLMLATAPAVLALDPTADPGPSTVEVNLGADPLMPYIVALLVMSGVLAMVGFVAMQVNRKPPAGARRRGQNAWWPCGSCATSNAGDRDTCYACAAPRHQPPA